MLNRVVLLFLFFFVLLGFGQNNTKQNKSTEVDLNQMVRKSHLAYAEGDIAEGLVLTRQALVYAKILDNEIAIAEIKQLRTKFFRINNEIDSAIYTLMSIDPDVLSYSNEKNNYVNDQLGEILLELGAYKSALPYLNKMVDFQKKKLSKFFALNLLGRAYLNIGYEDSTYQVFNRQLAIAKSLNDNHLVANALNNLGYVSLHFKRFNKAEVYLLNSISLIDKFDEMNGSDSIILMNVNSNLGLTFYNQKKYRTAIPYLENTFKALTAPGIKGHKWTWVASTGNLLHNSYLKINEFAKADDIYQLMEGKDTSVHFMWQFVDMTYHSALLSKDFDKIKSISRQRDSLFFEKFEEKNEVIQQKLSLLGVIHIQNAKKSLDLEKLKSDQIKIERDLIFRTAIMLVIVVVLIAFLFVFLFFQKKHKMRIRTKLYESQKKNIKYELELKTKDIVKLTMDMTQRAEWRDDLIKELTLINRMNDEDIKAALKSFIAQTKLIITSRSSMEVLQSNLNLVNEVFYGNLLKKHPHLSKYDQEFCAYIKLGMSNKEIANLKNIDPKSVRSSKSRMKKRLNIGDKDLYSYLQKM